MPEKLLSWQITGMERATMSWEDNLVIEVKISPYADRHSAALDYYRQSMRAELMRKVADHIGTNSTNVQFEEHIFESGYWGDTTLQIRARLGEVRQVELKPYPIPSIAFFDEKHRCTHCGGNTIDDSRGHCSGWGAPRR